MHGVSVLLLNVEYITESALHVKHTAVLLARLMLDAVVPGVTMYMYVCVHGFMKCSIQNSIIVFFFYRDAECSEEW